MNSRLRPLLFAVCLAMGLMIGMAGAAVAGNPSGTGQPNASCEDSRLEPNGFGSGGFTGGILVIERRHAEERAQKHERQEDAIIR